MICTVFNSVSSSIQKQQCKTDILNRRLIVDSSKGNTYLQYSMWPHDAELQRTVHLCMSVLTIILIRTPFLPCVVLETEDTLYKFYQQLQVASAMYVGLLLSVLSSCSKEPKGKLCLLCMYSISFQRSFVSVHQVHTLWFCSWYKISEALASHYLLEISLFNGSAVSSSSLEIW